MHRRCAQRRRQRAGQRNADQGGQVDIAQGTAGLAALPAEPDKRQCAGYGNWIAAGGRRRHRSLRPDPVPQLPWPRQRTAADADQARNRTDDKTYQAESGLPRQGFLAVGVAAEDQLQAGQYRERSEHPDQGLSVEGIGNDRAQHGTDDEAARQGPHQGPADGAAPVVRDDRTQ
jgi:hypothetical protein